MIAHAAGTPILVASHERSGTHLTIDLLRRHFPACSVSMKPLESPHNAYLSLDRFFKDAHRPITEAEAERALARAPALPLKTHAEPDLHEIKPDAKPAVAEVVEDSAKIYIVRDPVRVLCSYFAWMHSWRGPETGDFATFLREPAGRHRTRVERWAAHARRWSRKDAVLTIRYEDLTDDPEQILRRVAAWTERRLRLRKPLLPRRVRGVRSKLLTRLTGRYESTNLAGPTTRTPKPSEVFRPEDFDLLRETAGDVMHRFGYDTDPDWVRPDPPLAGKHPDRADALLT